MIGKRLTLRCRGGWQSARRFVKFDNSGIYIMDKGENLKWILAKYANKS